MNNYEDNPLVSVIVPAYNVSKYVSKCISSVLNQTYMNIEVIVINDGSTDNTPVILDSIAENDRRVKVIHKENAGVSIARNIGINISKGEYLVFVDGDDYIAVDYIEYMISLVRETNSEFCLSELCFTTKGESQTKNEKIKTVSAEDATALLLSPKIIVGCWNKIYKRDLIVNNNISFSPSLFYGEGLTFITTVSQLSGSVGVGNRKVYYYRRNNNESATTKFDVQKLYNGEKALYGIKENLLIESEKINTMFSLHISLFRLAAIVRIQTAGLKENYIDDYRRWKSDINGSILNLLFKKKVPTYRKLMLIIGCISPWILSKLDVLRRSRVVSNSVSD